jgi:hypothetical protein
MVNHRIYKFFDKYIVLWVPLAVLLFIIGSGLLVSVHLEYTPTEERDITNTKLDQVEMESYTSSVVTENTSLFNKSDVVTGPVYINGSNPNVTLTQTYRSDREIQMSSEVAVVINGSEDGWTFWKDQYVIDSRQFKFSGEYTYQSKINIQRIRNRALTIRDVFGGQGDIKVDIVIDNQYSNDLYSSSFDRGSRIIFRDQTYSIIPPERSYIRSHSYEVVQGTEEYGDMKFVKSGVGIIFAGLIILILRLVLADKSRRRKDYILMRFSDWISSADDLSTNVRNKDNVIELSSCEDLVDIAADSNRRVVYMKSRDLLFIIDDNILYEYKLEQHNDKVRFSMFGFRRDSNDKDNEDSDDGDSDDEDGSVGFSFTE